MLRYITHFFPEDHMVNFNIREVEQKLNATVRDEELEKCHLAIAKIDPITLYLTTLIRNWQQKLAHI